MLSDFDTVKTFDGLASDQRIYPEWDVKLQEMSKARLASYERHWGKIIYPHLYRLTQKYADFEDFWVKALQDEFTVLSRTSRRLLRQHMIKLILGDPFTFLKLKKRCDLKAFEMVYLGETCEVSANEEISKLLQAYHSKINPLLRDATLFVDLGSGWGRWSTYFASKNEKLKVLAGEVTDAGQKITSEISKRYNLNISAFSFDFLDWSSLACELKKNDISNVVIFSNFAIEQVRLIDCRMFESIIDLCENVNFFHVEPVGWQLKSAYGSKYNPIPAGQRFYFNSNFFPVFDHLVENGKLKVDEIVPDFVGSGAIGTLARFSKV